LIAEKATKLLGTISSRPTFPYLNTGVC